MGNETTSGGSQTDTALQNHTAGPRRRPAGPTGGPPAGAGVLSRSFQPRCSFLGILLRPQTEHGAMAKPTELPKVEGNPPQTLQTHRPPVLRRTAWRNLLFHGFHREATPTHHATETKPPLEQATTVRQHQSSHGEGESPILLTLPRELRWEESMVIAPAGMAHRH